MCINASDGITFKNIEKKSNISSNHKKLVTKQTNIILIEINYIFIVNKRRDD